VYGRTAKECRENYVTAMGDIQAGRLADDRRTKFADYLDRRLRWWESEDDKALNAGQLPRGDRALL
jgi:hypothetical protein